MSSDRKQISGYLEMEEREEQKGEVSKGREGSLWGDDPYFEFGDGYKTLCICQST